MLVALFNGVEPTSTRLSIAYNGLTLNNTADPLDDRYECDIVAVDEQYDGVIEPKTTTHGLESYEVRKMVTMIQIEGVIRAPSLGKLYDKVRDLNEAFDPILAQIADSSATRNIGYLPLTFSSPTLDTANYASGLIPMKYDVRSVRRPVSRSSQFEGLTCRFTLVLQAADPRAYFQTAQSAQRTNAGDITVNNSLASFPSWPTVTIDLSGGTSQVVSLAIAGGNTLKVDLTGLTSADTVVIDMENHEILLNGTIDMSLYNDGLWWELPAASKVVTVANVSGTLAGTVAVAWERAFV